MDPFIFIWATEEPPLPPKTPKPKRQRGKKAAQAKRKARVKT
jgi:hypothetical protein